MFNRSMSDSLEKMARGDANRGNAMKVFDWEKAARLIRERKPTEASAGLATDWEYTGGLIYANSNFVPREDTYTYLASTWATPELDMDGDVVDCYRMESDVPASWGDGDMADIYWPEAALAILNGEL